MRWIWGRKEAIHYSTPIKNVSNDIHTNPPVNQLPEAAREIGRQAADAAMDSVQNANAAAHRAADKAKEMYESAAVKAGDTLETSKDYVRRNPVPVVLGAIAFGAALGYMLMLARRKPTFSERCVDEPLGAVREAILSALAPVAHGVHKGYDSARDNVEKAMDRVHRSDTGRTVDSWSDQLGRVGSNLKFW